MPHYKTFIIKIGALFLSSFIYTQSIGQAFRFIKIENEKQVEIGVFEGNSSKKNTIKIPLKQSSDSTLIHNLGLDVQKNTLIFIHAWLGDKPQFMKKTITTLRQIIQSRADIDIQNIILIWWKPTHLTYKKSWEKADKIGNALSPIIQLCAVNQKGNLVLMCHSMGHRVFQGIWDTWENPTPNIFEKVIFIAPDLDTDAFEKNFANLPLAANKIIIYKNAKDVALCISEQQHGRPRMGKNGLIYYNPAFTNLETIDISSCKGSFWDSTKHIYHRHYLAVQSDLATILAKDYDKRKVKNIGKNVFQLMD